jgi:hypothetical protein
MTVGAGVGGIEQFHGPQIDLTGLHGHGHALLDGQTWNQQYGQGLIAESGDGGILLAEDGSMIGIGGDPFEAIE